MGTSDGQLFSYRINGNSINPVSGNTRQNTIGDAVLSISISVSFQIAAGGANQDITLYTLNGDNSFNLVTLTPIQFVE